MFRIRVLKFLDRWFGNALVQLLPGPPTPPERSEPRAILLIRPGGIGDAVLLVPVIHVLRERFPQATIDILAERRNAGAFALCPGIGKVYLYDRPGQLLAVLNRRYDVVIDTEQWHRLSAITARLASAPIKIGFATNQRQRMFTHAVSYSHEDYEVASFFSLIEPLGVIGNTLPERPWLHVPDIARQAGASLLRGRYINRYIVIFPGASVAEKHWGADRFQGVAGWCLDHGLDVVIIGGESDRAEGEKVAAGLAAINLVGMTSLAETSSILEHASLVVAGDSGVLHIAAGLGRPTVAMFGPSSSVKWAPRGQTHVTLQKAACAPCSRFGNIPECPSGHRCMQDITVSDVTNAISDLLNLSGAKDRP